MKTLVAEDEPTSRFLLKQLLSKWGHEVVAVTDGWGAWEALQGPDAPRVAVLDWMMPGIEGPEVCRLTRALPITPPPYLLLLTAKESEAGGTAALQAGANDYLTKPINAEELRVRLEVGLRTLESK